MMFNAGPEGEINTSPLVLTYISSADALAIKLFRRARNAGTHFEDVSTVVRSLHGVLKHLKVEAEDPESLLNSDDSNVYVRQVTPMIEDMEFTLKQLETILEKYLAGVGGNGAPDGDRHMLINDSEKGWTMLDSVEREKIDLIRSKLSQQKLHVDMFLDTIQLHNPSKTRQTVDTSTTEMEAIKDKVDAIASRLCRRTNSGLSEEDHDELWEQFRDALEAEGFSKDVLRSHQDVLRAYIRQLEEQTNAYESTAPSVRALLEHYDPSYTPSPGALPYPEDVSPDGSNSPLGEDEEYFPSTRMERLHYEDYSHQPPQLHTGSTGLSFDHRSSDDDYEPSSQETALISTRDLMALDNWNADLADGFGNMHLGSEPPQNGNYTTSDQRYLPSSSQPALLGPPPPHSPLGATHEEQYSARHDPQPRYVPMLPPPARNGRSPPPTLHSNSISAPAVAQDHQAMVSQRYARLNPDGQGREIPLDAKWTRIRRSLVSPEVLKQQGFRYEARPDFVAVLGELTKGEICNLAKLSTEVRNSRKRSTSDPDTVAQQSMSNGVEKKDRRPEDRYHPDKYRNWDVIEGQRERDMPGYVINPHGRNRAHSTVSSVTSELWDSEDDVSSSSSRFRDDRSQAYMHPSSFPNSYPPPHPHSAPYHHSFANTRDYPPSISEDGDEKGTKAYPFIVSPPQDGEDGGDGRDKVSPAATVLPKSILKNKNDDPRVRFDPTPQFYDEGSSSHPRGPSSRRHDKEDREKSRSGNKDRDRERRHRSDRYADRDRYGDREHRGGGGKPYSSRRDDYDGRRDRNRDRPDRDRATRKKTRSETLRAAGIGGAAVTLLSVLTEAAAGL